MTDLKPIYLLAGRWGKNPDPVITEAIQESGKEKPTIAYVGAASGDNVEFFNRLASYFHEANSGDVKLAPTVAQQADVTKTKMILQSADMIFISGGDVEAGIEVLHQRKLVSYIGELYRKGKPFFAVSAGSIMLAKEWVRWTNPDDDSSATKFPCLNIAPVICDTHGETDNWEELKALLMLEKPGTIGYGIVSGNAIKVYPDGRVEAISGRIHRFTRGRIKVDRLPDLQPGK